MKNPGWKGGSDSFELGSRHSKAQVQSCSTRGVSVYLAEDVLDT